MNEKMSKPIGTKTTTLKPSSVEILSVRFEDIVDSKTGKIVQKVVLSCKHPDRSEPIELSGVEYRRGKSIQSSGLWYKEDEDGNISKDSALALFMEFMGASTLNQLEGLSVSAVQGENGFLTIKAY